jgi:hypothetical protein
MSEARPIREKRPPRDVRYLTTGSPSSNSCWPLNMSQEIRHRRTAGSTQGHTVMARTTVATRHTIKLMAEKSVA